MPQGITDFSWLTDGYLKVCSRETKTISNTLPNLEILSIGKDTFRKTSLERPLISTADQPCASKFQGIDSWIHMSHLKKEPNSVHQLVT